MKKVLFFALAAGVALAACTKNEVRPVNVDQEITYQTISTKASAFNTNCKFYSWAYLLAEGQTWADNSADAKLYIENSLIEYVDVDESHAWKNARDSYYWPKKAGLTFFAWSDSTSTPKVTSPATVACYNDAGIKFDNFDTSVDKNKDLLVSKIAADQTIDKISSHGPWVNGVPVVFYHVLSAMNVTAATKIDYGMTFKVKSVVFNNVLCKGDYTQGVVATKTPLESRWTTDDSKTSSFHVYNCASLSDVLSTNPTPLEAQTGDVRIYMPQDFNDATAKVSVTYQVTYGNTGITDKDVTIVKDLKSIFTNGWKPCYKYTLNIVIGLDEIFWDPTVEPWTPASQSVNI